MKEEKRYHYSPLCFGIGWTFSICIFIIVLPILLLSVLYKSRVPIPLHPNVSTPIVVVIMLALWVAVAVIANRVVSPFEKARRVIQTFTGGGMISIFHASYPFFKLLVYEDGLELRVLFHSYFIPYDKMEDWSKNEGASNRGLLIKCELPDVPSSIRFATFSTSDLLILVNYHRKIFLERVKIPGL